MSFQHNLITRLIGEVKKYPCLYNTDFDEYKDYVLKEECWAKIAIELNSPSDGLRKSWKRLRDCYRQALARRTNKTMKLWRYESQMKFVLPFLTTRPRPKQNFDVIFFPGPDKNDVEKEEMTEIETSQQLQSSSTFEEIEESKPMIIPKPNERILPTIAEIAAATNSADDLDLFFASMCASAKKLPRRYQNIIKRDLLETLMRVEEMYEMEKPGTSSCHADLD